MSENELYGLAVKLFEEHRDAEADGWAPNLWKVLQQTGFSDVPIPEELGGAGGSVADAVQLLRAAGAHAAPVPLAEAGLVGGWLLASVSIPVPNGVRTILLPGHELRLDRDRLSGTASAIPWGRDAEHVIGLVDGTVVLAPGPVHRPAGGRPGPGLVADPGRRADAAPAGGAGRGPGRLARHAPRLRPAAVRPGRPVR